MLKTLIFFLVLVLSACNGTTPNPAPTVSQKPSALPVARPAKVLLWIGAGTWARDTIDNELILTNLGIKFDPILSLAGIDYSKYSAIIMPGGSAKTQANGLAVRTKGGNTFEASEAMGSEKGRLVQAINEGLNYLGYCAGAFLVGDYGTWGLKLFPVDLPYTSIYSPDLLQAVPIVTHCCESSSRSMLYYGGPSLDGIGGQAIANFADGEAAIVQKRAGQGLVIVSSVHPESSPDTLSLLSVIDQDGEDVTVNEQLIAAVINNKEVTIQ